jgi:hypothetical protein
MELHHKQIQPIEMKMNGFQGFFPKPVLGVVLVGRKQFLLNGIPESAYQETLWLTW